MRSSDLRFNSQHPSREESSRFSYAASRCAQLAQAVLVSKDAASEVFIGDK
jgi:hypothetical protein